MARMGPPVLLDETKEKQLKALCRYKPTLLDAAAFLDLHPSTIEKFLRKKYKKTYSEFRDENMVHTRMELIRKSLDMAKGGNTAMMIFCLKNICGWTDKFESTVDNKSSDGSMTPAQDQKIDVSKLSTEELQQFRALLAKAKNEIAKPQRD